MSTITIVTGPGAGVYTEKRSRFVGAVYSAVDADMVERLLAETRRAHLKANHICYAFRLGRAYVQEFSTDGGEPSGSAGRPILGVLQRAGVCDALAVVVRYYGGKRLGMRGLIEAYRDAAAAALEDASLSPLQCYESLSLTLDYNMLGRVKHLVGVVGGEILDTVYDARVLLTIGVFPERLEEASARLGELNQTGRISGPERNDVVWLPLSGDH